MNFELFISKRLATQQGKNFTSIIMRIAVVAVAMSIAVMIITTNVITGFKKEISNKVFDFWGHIHITDTNADNTFEIISIDADPGLIEEIKNIKKVSYQMKDYNGDPMYSGKYSTSKGGVKHVQQYVVLPAVLSDDKNFEGILCRGVGMDYDSTLLVKFIKEGSFIKLNDTVASRDILISTITANRMKLKLSDRLILNFIIDGEPVKRAFRITGIYKTGLEEYDKTFALMDIRTLQELMKWNTDQISGLEVFVDNTDDITLINEYIYFEKLPQNLYSQSVRSKFYEIFEWLDLQDINERVIFILMTLVAVINMITALLIFVLERTKMIGILKAVGSTNWQIRKIFLISAQRIVLKGALLGNIIGLSFCLLQKSFNLLSLPEADYYLDHVPIDFNIPMMIWINLGAITIIMLCMLIPSLVVSHISPVKTIQYK